MSDNKIFQFSSGFRPIVVKLQLPLPVSFKPGIVAQKTKLTYCRVFYGFLIKLHEIENRQAT